MKTPAELRQNAANRSAEAKAKPVGEYAVSRAPRPGSETFWLERDTNGHAYSVFRGRVRPDGNLEVNCILDGALYVGARESVLKHTVENSARAVERDYE